MYTERFLSCLVEYVTCISMSQMCLFCLEQDQWHTKPPNHVSLSPTHSTPKPGGKGNFIIILKIAFCSFIESTQDYRMMSCVLSTLPFWLMNSSNH